MNKRCKELLATLPKASGVYIMLDEFDNVLYVGKAKNLSNRVRQYFQKNVKNAKTIVLVNKISHFRYIITPNEYEALILENNLIKEFSPPFNILLKDDKTYPYIKINLKNDFPKLEISYKLKSDGAKYFGPFMLGISTKDIIELINSIFLIRECSKMPKKECLNYHIGRCSAPCIGKISIKEYHNQLKKVIKFLSGNDTKVVEMLNEKMQLCVEKEEFERAMYFRDRLEMLENLRRKQQIPFKQELNIDVFCIVSNGIYSVVFVCAVRNGKFLGGTNFPYNEVDCVNGLTSFVMQYYQKNPILCKEILVNQELEFGQELNDYINKLANRKIVLTLPIYGIRKQILDFGNKNAEDYLKRQLEHYNKKQELTLGAIEKLFENLKLSRLPKRIECYDVSHISGTNKVASMVVFENGEKAVNMYRSFNIRDVEGNNDFASLQEALSRRLVKIKNCEDISFDKCPDLIVIDGGKGQLSSVMKIFKQLKITNIDLVSLAKREEEVFLPNQSESIMLDRNGVDFKLITNLRDEAHRFAITHHRNMRLKKMTESNLIKINGIGKNKARNLLEYFKKYDKIKEASIEELCKVNGISEKIAIDIKKFFVNNEKFSEDIK
ncbi:MAG: excinuclease ABC subunit UvrC [Clostridia bacterium]